MQTTAPARIIKKNRIALAGSIALDQKALENATAKSQPGKPARKATAKVIETTDAYVTIEVTCGCGTKSYIQCNYTR